ncbi:GDSL-type esterase/lipase family protein [Streptomyces sp. ADMS]|uniref:GDSL-type esterase/lipase family protein n=1 Tax=Streptomyces sp. ADMS TaxID=3071415 RepID=UPI00296F5482|nr:GDSL-type esterase/lipase family protein [Streptomyces sp. ADMS]MDW4909994.1 GDSL-type esterase/lipase family protein [Streptomyces sp. ADMS]
MLRLMPVGDSMTIGSAGEHTWRYRLWQHLRETYGGPFRIVGPREALYDKATDTADSYEYADPDFPRAHLAGWGEGWHHMTPLIADAVRAHKPDVLLVSLGLIDLGFYTDAEQTAEKARTFIAEARRSNPRIAIALLPVIPNVRAESDPPFGAEVTLFNELLAKTAANLDEPRSPLLLTSPPPSYDVNHDTYDGTHPNAKGEHKIAGAFADSLYEAWDLGERYGAETD